MSSEQIAVQAITSKGGRATEARVRTLAALLRSAVPLTHAEIEATLSESGPLDRVTLYRVLDWLVAHGLAHRIEGGDRIWRFNATKDEEHTHAHFSCMHCGRVYCLNDIRPAFAFALPAGFHAREAELSFRGVCPDCEAEDINAT